MILDALDPTAYVRAPLIDVASGVALATALLAAAPKDGSEAVKKAIKRLRKDTTALQEAWAKSEATAPQVDRRAADARIDAAWGMLLDRLAAYGGLPPAMCPKAPRARALVETLSPDRAWLKLPYTAEWAESERRLARIDAEALAHDIDLLAGPEFLAELREAHHAYGVALGMKGTRVVEASVSLTEPLRGLSQAIARYSRAIVGELDEDDAASVARTKAALRPIDEHRAAQGRRASASPAAPAPTPPAGGTSAP